MNRRQLLRRLARGSIANVDFADMVDLVEGFGFQLARIRGSHHIFVHPDVPELVNFQEVHSQSKPYQIKQFMRIVERYNLVLRDKSS
jgi:predicted RNA binding protein YcfA (HicA-like mRNA interferase family)